MEGLTAQQNGLAAAVQALDSAVPAVVNSAQTIASGAGAVRAAAAAHAAELGNELSGDLAAALSKAHDALAARVATLLSDNLASSQRLVRDRLAAAGAVTGKRLDAAALELVACAGDVASAGEAVAARCCSVERQAVSSATAARSLQSGGAELAAAMAARRQDLQLCRDGMQAAGAQAGAALGQLQEAGCVEVARWRGAAERIAAGATRCFAALPRCAVPVTGGDSSTRDVLVPVQRWRLAGPKCERKPARWRSISTARKRGRPRQRRSCTQPPQTTAAAVQLLPPRRACGKWCDFFVCSYPNLMSRGRGTCCALRACAPRYSRTLCTRGGHVHLTGMACRLRARASRCYPRRLHCGHSRCLRSCHRHRTRCSRLLQCTRITLWALRTSSTKGAVTRCARASSLTAHSLRTGRSVTRTAAGTPACWQARRVRPRARLNAGTVVAVRWEPRRGHRRCSPSPTCLRRRRTARRRACSAARAPSAECCTARRHLWRARTAPHAPALQAIAATTPPTARRPCSRSNIVRAPRAFPRRGVGGSSAAALPARRTAAHTLRYGATRRAVWICPRGSGTRARRRQPR